MDTSQTWVVHSKEGWHASTQIELEANRIVEIRTRRMTGSNQLVTSACVSRVQDNVRTHMIGYGTLEGDFNKRVLAEIAPRVTEKLVRAQHNTALAQIDSIKQAIASHYAAQQQQRQAASVETAPTAQAV